MIVVFECVARAIKEKGFRGLLELVPGGPYAFEIAGYAYKLYLERKKEAALKAELAKVAEASVAEARRVAAEVARRIMNEGPDEERLALELYLTQLPGAMRQSLKRAADPTGKTLPPDFALDASEGFLRMLPQRLPRFRPGTELPGRAGWRLDELLGTGGFGEVWLTRHALLPHPRAVKFCTDATVRARLTSHEANVIARVMEQGSHPNVVPLLDAVLDGDTPWLMYEYVGGGSLIEQILAWQTRPVAEREAAATLALRQLASAVSAFHRLTPALVHRDLKPANILVSAASTTRDSLGGTLKITDFGVGGVALDEPRTHTGAPLPPTGWLQTALRGSYSPLYASPQQIRGAAPDPRDDVHALGVIAYQMLTGQLTEAPSPRFDRDLKRLGVSQALIDLIGDCVESDLNIQPRDAGTLAERLGERRSAVAPARAERRKTLAVGPLEGGAATVTILPLASATEAESWHIPLRGMWFTRPKDSPDAAWLLRDTPLPGKVLVKPNEAYRIALHPDTTDDDLAELRALSGLPGLEACDLSGCLRVTDAGVMQLASLRGVKAVALAETRVTDAGVALLLTRFPELESLVLTGAASVSPDVMAHLARMRKLKFLALPPRADTEEARTAFAKRRPTCRLM